MSKEKAELKKLIFHELGAQVEDMQEGALKERQSLAGGKMALRQAAAHILGLQEAADKDLDSGVIPDGDCLKVVKLYIERARQTCLGAAQNLENKEIAATGAHTFGGNVVALFKKMYDEEDNKAKALESEEHDPRRRPLGAHPGPSLAQQRKAEDAKEKELQGKKKKVGKKKVSRAKDSR